MVVGREWCKLVYNYQTLFNAFILSTFFISTPFVLHRYTLFRYLELVS